MEKPTEYTLTWTVTDEMTAKRIGGAGSKILSTPISRSKKEAPACQVLLFWVTPPVRRTLRH